MEIRGFNARARDDLAGEVARGGRFVSRRSKLLGTRGNVAKLESLRGERQRQREPKGHSRPEFSQQCAEVIQNPFPCRSERPERSKWRAASPGRS